MILEKSFFKEFTMSKTHQGTLYLIIFSWLSLFVLGLVDNSRGPLFSLILQDLNLSHLKGSLFFSVGSFVAIIGSFSCKYLFRYFTSYRIFQFSLCGFICLGFSLYKTQSFTGLMFSAILFGISFGTVSVAQNVMASFETKKLSSLKSFSVLHSMYAIAALMAPLVANRFLAHDFNWNFIFLILCWSSIPVLLASLFFKNPPQKIQKDETPSLELFPEWKKWSLLFGLYVSAELMVSTRLVVFLESGGWSLSQAQYGLAFFFLGLFLGRLALVFIDIKNELKYLTTALITSTVVLLVSLLFFKPAVVLLGFCLSVFFPLAMNYLAKATKVHKNLFGQVSSVVITCASVIVVLMHMLIGLLTDYYGSQNSFYLGVLLLSGAYGVSYLLFKNQPPKRGSAGSSSP